MSDTDPLNNGISLNRADTDNSDTQARSPDMAPSTDTAMDTMAWTQVNNMTSLPIALELTDGETLPQMTDLELPSILLTPDGNSTIDLSDQPPSADKLQTPRTSYNSLLHWGNIPSKHDVEYLINKYSELPGSIMCVEIKLTLLMTEPSQSRPPQLGLRLAGHRDLNQMSVFVCGLRPGSVAELDGGIEIGDQLLEVNDHTLYGLSHLNAAPIIRSEFTKALRQLKFDCIRFVLQRDETNWGLMAAHANHVGAENHSTKSSRRNSTDTNMTFTSMGSGPVDVARKSLDSEHDDFNPQHGHLIERTTTIQLHRGSGGYGFTVTEGSGRQACEHGVFVDKIIDGGTATKDGGLCPGDHLLRINNRDATNVSHLTVIEWINSTEHELTLQVGRWCVDSKPANDFRRSRSPCNHSYQKSSHLRPFKRLSAPQLFSSFTSLFRSHDAQNRHSRSSKSQRDGQIGRNSLLPLKEVEPPDSATVAVNAPAKTAELRLASSPNLPSLVLTPAGQVQTSVYPSVSLTNPGSPVAYSPDMCDPTIHNCHSTFTLDSPNYSLSKLPINTISLEPEICRQILPGAETRIELEITKVIPLGIGFIGGSETALNKLVVHEVYENGLAHKDGRLKPGDGLLQVNSISLIGLPFNRAVYAIRSTYNGAMRRCVHTQEGNEDNENRTTSPIRELATFRLTVQRPEFHNRTVWYDEQVVVELVKKPGRGLGLCIVDRSIRDQSPNGPEETESTPSLHNGVIVDEVIKGSVAAIDGRILAKDQILAVDEQDTATLDSIQVGALFKAAPNKVTIKVGRLKNQVPLAAFHDCG